MLYCQFVSWGWVMPVFNIDTGLWNSCEYYLSPLLIFKVNTQNVLDLFCLHCKANLFWYVFHLFILFCQLLERWNLFRELSKTRWLQDNISNISCWRLNIIINFIYDIIQNYFIPSLHSIVERPINSHSFILPPIYLLSQSSRIVPAHSSCHVTRSIKDDYFVAITDFPRFGQN